MLSPTTLAHLILAIFAMSQAKEYEDPIMRALTTSLYPALDQPEQANRLFVDHVMLAVGFHVAQTYGDLKAVMAHGGLAPWQERRAKEIIDANLNGEILLAELAKQCGLSSSHFSRAFRQIYRDLATSVAFASAR
jgi:AraC family transcriptional regulator